MATVNIAAKKPYTNERIANFAKFHDAMLTMPSVVEPPDTQQIYRVLDGVMSAVLTNQGANAQQLLGAAAGQVNNLLAATSTRSEGPAGCTPARPVPPLFCAPAGRARPRTSWRTPARVLVGHPGGADQRGTRRALTGTPLEILLATMVMASISMIVVFFVLQRHIVAGLLAGSSTG
ncbi:MAG: sugar transporter substrate-binding protein [Acidimicrobiaceae bacterium]|nr:sugar transporter substrate-binding protein [Acidimicrobiaceae bacterium]